MPWRGSVARKSPWRPSGGQLAALARLPLAALRLPEQTLDGLRLMGIERIGALAALPRAPLVRRFGALVTTRLDQAFGRVAEAIEPEFPPDLIQARLTFVEPLLTAEAFATVIDRLTATVCADLERPVAGRAGWICCSSAWTAPPRRSISARRVRPATHGIWRDCCRNGSSGSIPVWASRRCG